MRTPVQSAPIARPTALPTFVAGLRLLRLSNSLSAAALVLVGTHLLEVWPWPGAVWRAALAMWCVTAFGYVSNDLSDLGEDRMNKPDRPLAAGTVSPQAACWLAIALTVAALILAASISLLAFGTATLVIALLYLYNQCLKASPGAGNGLIAVLAGCALLTGGVAALGFAPWQLLPLLPPMLTLMTFVGAREVLKTVEDMAGDGRVNKRTIAIQWGIVRTRRIYAALAITTLLLGLLPVWRLGYSVAYLGVMTVGVYLPLLLPLRHRHLAAQEATSSLVWLKASYFAGILALLLA